MSEKSGGGCRRQEWQVTETFGIHCKREEASECEERKKF